MNTTEVKLGFWASVLSALFSIIWFITYNLRDAFQAVPNWKDLQAYADAFRVVRLAYVYPSLLLALTYIILLACIHRVVSEEKKIWSLIALSIGILYSVMASINYNIQAVAVRLSLAAGETHGIEMLIPDNLNSIFNALANSYVYMALSMYFLGFVFSKGRNERWIKGLLLVQVVTAIGQVGYSMFDMNTGIFIATSMVWVIGAPLVFILIAVWFNRQRI
ncbi:hypothetical protein MFMK1_001493 [Metallumcola ferriviriculae]|uniref:DUF4386 family protein n=1 Tax=Metallumcola ferriviriculae TaxID=3039180 RepID=A0AAU0UK28_9FIRM|nr:hypothetical protein MFMK1_001493 [Desulfitibacteraceae bacterium MK1]